MRNFSIVYSRKTDDYFDVENNSLFWGEKFDGTDYEKYLDASEDFDSEELYKIIREYRAIIVKDFERYLKYIIPLLKNTEGLAFEMQNVVDTLNNGVADGLDEVATALPPILESIIGTDYDGPLGIDMMTVNGDGYTLAPAVELNLRMTMGHVARIFYDKHIAPGHTATLTVENRGAGTDTTVLSGGRIAGGTLSLSTPGSPFSFTIRAE